MPDKKIRLVYDHGYPFSEILIKNLVGVYRKVFLENKAGCILIDGPVGSGKTTLGILIADYFEGREIKFEEHLAMGGEDFLKKMKLAQEKAFKCLIYDEAGDFNRRGSLTKFNANLNRVWETYRAFKLVPIIILPLVADLDDGLMKKGILSFLLHCHSRTNRMGNFMGF
jgi:hypothetical protein